VGQEVAVLRRSSLAAMAAIAACCAVVRAQEVPLLAPGQLVRVTIPSRLIAGGIYTLASIRGGTVTLREPRYRSDATVGPHGVAMDSVDITAALDSVPRFEIGVGQRRLGRQGALAGAVLGATLGVLTARPSSQPCGYMDSCSLKDARWTGGIVGALVGAGFGALIGHAIRVERWVPVPLDRLRLELGALPTGGADLRFCVAF
jgi:hypothetical protein